MNRGTEKYPERVTRVFGSLIDVQKKDSEEVSIRMNKSDDITLQQRQCHRGITGSQQLPSGSTSSSLFKEGSLCDREESALSCAKPRRQRSHRALRYVPDYIKHPGRWVKYDLKNDGTERMVGMSADQQNRLAALEFLQMRTGSATGNTAATGTTETLIKFKKPKLKLPEYNAEVTPPLMFQEKTCNHIMKEYIVGAKKERKLKRVPAESPTCISSVHLSHLEECDSPLD